MNQLALSARPRTLDQLVGQDKIVKAIRGHVRSNRIIKSWLFTGPKGTGKTTISRILALSYQCTHQKIFGAPCLTCRKNKSSFMIHEINTADLTGVDSMRDKLQGASYGVMGAGKYRVYILDECHRLTKNSQDLLLKYLEDTPPTTVFILCSTKPWQIVETMRSRCIVYQLSELGTDDIPVLVKKLLKKIDSKLPVDRLSEALIDQQVRSPRNICNAVEKYVAGELPDDAAQVEGMTAVDVHTLTRGVIKGNWESVRTYLLKAENLDMKSVRIGVVAYLRTILLESAEISVRTKVVADAIEKLSTIQYVEDSVLNALLGSVLYRVTALFSKYKR